MQDSEHVMNCNLRREKVHQVHVNLEKEQAFMATRGKSGPILTGLANMLNVELITGAMSDIYDRKKRTWKTISAPSN